MISLTKSFISLLFITCPLSLSAVHANETTIYTYDALGRLQRVAKSGGPTVGRLIETTYDKAGNRTNQNISDCGNPFTLNSGQVRYSQNGQYRLAMQGDGNLVTYGPSGAIWHARTYGTGADRARFQSDGHLYVYSSGSAPVWSSQTWGNNCATLAMQDDGNLVIYSVDNVPIWSSYDDTAGLLMPPPAPPPPPPPPPCGNPFDLLVNESFYSPNGQYRLVMQGDGNLVTYGPVGAIWNARTQGTGANRAIFQSDGHFYVLGQGATPIWSSGTAGNNCATLAMQDDGNLVIYSVNNVAIWASSYDTAGLVPHP